MAEHTGEKTHEATPHRRQEARRKGQVATSQDLGSETEELCPLCLAAGRSRAALPSFATLPLLAPAPSAGRVCCDRPRHQPGSQAKR